MKAMHYKIKIWQTLFERILNLLKFDLRFPEAILTNIFYRGVTLSFF